MTLSNSLNFNPTQYLVVIGGANAEPLDQIAGLGTATQVLTSNGPGVAPTFQDATGGGAGPPGSTQSFFLWEDFIYPKDALGFFNCGGFFGAGVAGTGASVQQGDTDATHFGIVDLITGTTTTGNANIATAQDCFLFGAGTYEVEFLLNIDTLSTSAQRYILYLGFSDAGTTEPFNGAYFVYSDNVNSGNWQAKTAATTSRTTANSTNVVATGWTKLRISVNADGTSVSFFVNGVEIDNSPITTNIPTGASEQCGLFFSITKSVGTTSRFIQLDYVSCNINLTAAR